MKLGKILISASVVALFMTIAVSKAKVLDTQRISKTYYISSSKGDDSNDGLSEKNPKQHISSVTEKRNIRILLCRGDVFFDQIHGYSNCEIGDYGRGDRPVICGFKILTNSLAWEYDKKHECWVLDLMNVDDFQGIKQFDEPLRFVNNIGFIYQPQADRVYGHRVREIGALKQIGDFFLSDKYVTKTITGETFRYLRWKLDDNPKKLGYLCFPMCLVGVKNLKGCLVHDVAIVGFNFGIAACSGSTFENCQIDLIGGSVQIGMQDWMRYGNGIEFWYDCHDNTVSNCIISRTYDCGSSIQARGDIKSSPQNIRFTNNKFYHCRQAFEFFLNATNGFKPKYDNCSFSNNECYLMGENGFSTPELRDANLLSYDWNGKNISIKHNVFFGAPHFYRSSYPTGMMDNTIYIYEGQYLCNRKGDEQPPIFANSTNDVEKYRMQSGDNSTVVILKRGSKKAKRIEKKLWEQLDWKPVDLHLERL